ncbi:hypothetical protein Bhyg_01817 [Pseudolycoriella hygida]|uniref:Uncharacterized protein n=1 Tax=Pseudolycoriella hygida TaxID=35572 RepID=A0A9Q0NAC0_9DIPT|nr:hypothetical protein Bhyg_01817 [Pseudolycoriella hygida]
MCRVAYESLIRTVVLRQFHLLPQANFEKLAYTRETTGLQEIYYKPVRYNHRFLIKFRKLSDETVIAEV